MAKKIFAIEGEWDNKHTHKEAIVPILDLMRDVSGVKYVFRKVNTTESLIKYLKKATLKTMNDYDFIVLAFHGDNEQSFELSTNQEISLKSLGEEMKGKFEGKHIHFSSCGIGSKIKKLKRFKEATGSSQVTAYSNDVDFFESSLFDAAIIEHHFIINDEKDLKKYMKSIFPKWYKDLGFVVV